MKEGIYGLDLVKFMPDYSKSAEENLKAFREAFRKIYGEYPPSLSENGAAGYGRDKGNFAGTPRASA